MAGINNTDRQHDSYTGNYADIHKFQHNDTIGHGEFQYTGVSNVEFAYEASALTIRRDGKTFITVIAEEIPAFMSDLESK